jgi:hypothetical protein
VVLFAAVRDQRHFEGHMPNGSWVRHGVRPPAFALATHLEQQPASTASETMDVRPCAVAGWLELAFVLRRRDRAACRTNS